MFLSTVQPLKSPAFLRGIIVITICTITTKKKRNMKVSVSSYIQGASRLFRCRIAVKVILLYPSEDEKLKTSLKEA